MTLTKRELKILDNANLLEDILFGRYEVPAGTQERAIKEIKDLIYKK